MNYYENNAESYVAGTVNVYMKDVQEKFLSHLQENPYILDFGCGSGRDTKDFLERGLKVDAIDGSKELSKMASDFTGIKVEHKLFTEFEAYDKYDGIWACSSILHLKYNDLLDVFKRMERAVKSNGIIYASFKYGEFEGMRYERYFTDMTNHKIKRTIRKIDNLEVYKMWISVDARPGREDETWLNVILKKVAFGGNV